MTASYGGARASGSWARLRASSRSTQRSSRRPPGRGLGLVVLKTVIARDPAGGRSMSAWAIRESRMIVEPIVSPVTGAEGWTVTWKGRGWWQSFEDYLELVRAGCAIGRRRGLLVVPSVKYHLPARSNEPWREEEYVETTRALMAAYGAVGCSGPMPLEKDFSPTLAGSDRSEPAGHGDRLAPAGARTDPPIVGRQRIGPGRAEAVQHAGGRRLPACYARRGPRSGPARISWSTPIGSSIPIASSRAGKAWPTVDPTSVTAISGLLSALRASRRAAGRGRGIDRGDRRHGRHCSSGRIAVE